MYYLEILPISKTGPGNNVFTYESEEEILLGSLVSVPLRNRLVRGIVTKVVKKPNFPTKPIAKVLEDNPVLTETQLKLAQLISDYYLAGLGETIGGMLPFDFGKKRRLKETENVIKKAESPLPLTSDQDKVLATIKKGKKGSKYLLYGVTGSGKTEIYLQLAAEAINAGGSVIILIPEISLTPQTADRFEKRFPGQVAVWHSDLLETEKYHTWKKIKSGQARVVLGARSAIFAPVADLRYLVIDEEHEGSYKQDQNPRYEAGKVAEWACDLTGAKLIAGSATPRIESYYKIQSGEYQLCTMSKRIVQDSMPPVKIVDLRDEFRKGNKSIISDDLYDTAKTALNEGKQVLLFVNRRGASTFVVCRDCGTVLSCPHCEIPLTYHPSEGEILSCHHCGFSRPVPSVCPKCSSHAIRYFGLGTQRAEIEVKKMFPNARVARMDRDTVQKRGAHGALYSDFKNKNIDILIGTQIITKGWDLPNVAVVGVISADTMLNLPDFRSSERTFDLLTQVAGRTGRGYHPGTVIIQTYSPDNYAINLAAAHDFPSFYEREITERQKYGYPPYTRLVRIIATAKEEAKAEAKAQKTAQAVQELTEEKVQLYGPNPAFLPKLAGKYRFQVVLKIAGDSLPVKLEKVLKEAQKESLIVDIDPDSLL